jgi:methyltransferase (TIGR00027 family)
MEERLIRSVADTARWVAFHRAIESERTDALFSDPYARKLAGERGEQIAKHLDVGQHVALRTVLFDSLIHKQLTRAPIDMVINLAAGMDARPYRLKLPRSLRWVEVDLPEIVNTKKIILAKETASCKLKVFAQDLADTQLRQHLFTKLNTEATLAMVLSEGLLLYLTEDQVTALAADIRAKPHFQYWVVEVVGPKVIEAVKQTWGRHAAAAGAPLHFGPRDWRGFYAKRGWKVNEFCHTHQVAVKYGREPAPSATLGKIKHAVRAIGQKLQVFGERKDEWVTGVAILEKI